MAKTITRLEGLAVFLACLILYNQTGTSWVLFILLWLVPDLSIVGYLKSKELGIITYNLVHNYVLVFLIIALGLLLQSNLVISLSIILASHIGLDRLLGYGIKYSLGYKDTHIQKL